MLTEEEARAIGLNHWHQLATTFAGANVLLGNGFSINLAPEFAYESLFSSFLSQCDPGERQLFGNFKTTNFEDILHQLQTAQKVNDLFGINSDFSPTIGRLKSGLLTAIEQNHPRASDVEWDRLEFICNQLNQFGDIFTLNYDLLLYHVIMKGLDVHRVNPSFRPYNDFFWQPHDAQFLQFMDYQSYPKYKHVYYLHGALFIFDHPFLTLKVRRSGTSELVEVIARQIKDDKFPLFVSEGSAEQKMSSISKSYYLSFARSKLKQSSSRMVVYGTSLSLQDRHIVETLQTRSRQIAVALRTVGKARSEVQAQMDSFRHTLSGHEVVFFDASTLFVPSTT